MSFNFDDLVAGAKDVFDKAAAKAGEAIDYSKTQIDRGQLRSKIKELQNKLDEADIAVNAKKTKVCKFCETANDAASVYCTKCGEKL